MYSGRRVRVEQEAVLGAKCSAYYVHKIIDVSGSEPKEYRGVVPARSCHSGNDSKRIPCRNIPGHLVH